MKDFKLTPTGIVAVVALAFLCASSMFVAWKLLFGRPVEDVRLASLSPSVPAPASTLLAGEEGVTPIVKTTASETPMDVEPALQASGTLTHTVQAGENLYRISLAYGVSVTDIMSANSLFDSRFITVGQELRIPIERRLSQPCPAPRFL
jgi:LysM repeat protein